jgi:hypothetical protein
VTKADGINQYHCPGRDRVLCSCSIAPTSLDPDHLVRDRLFRKPDRVWYRVPKLPCRAVGSISRRELG